VTEGALPSPSLLLEEVNLVCVCVFLDTVLCTKSKNYVIINVISDNQNPS